MPGRQAVDPSEVSAQGPRLPQTEARRALEGWGVRALGPGKILGVSPLRHEIDFPVWRYEKLAGVTKIRYENSLPRYENMVRYENLGLVLRKWIWVMCVSCAGLGGGVGGLACMRRRLALAAGGRPRLRGRMAGW